ARDRVAPLEIVEHVLRFDADLQAVLSERNRPEHRQIQVPVRRPAELVASAVAPRIAGLRKGGRVVPRVVWPCLPEPWPRVSRHIDRLETAGLLEQAVVTAD